MKKYIIQIAIAVLALFIMLIIQSIKLHDGKMHIIFCTNEEGNGILLKTPKGSLIVNNAGDQVNSCIDKYNTFWDRTITMIILTNCTSQNIYAVTALLD